MVLRLKRVELREVELHLCRSYPEEGCGVLIGREGPEAREIVRAIGLENRQGAERHRRYLVAPEQFLETDAQARAAGLEVLGFFHSHPDAPAVPSSFDLEQAWDYYSYLILSVAQGAVADARSWRLRADRSGFDPEPLEVADLAATRAGEA
jgi:proteasome lid subunit RPN8/RPN11